MQYQQGDYTVVAARPVGAAPVALDVPGELRQRLYGRRLTRQQLQEVGVEFRGTMAVVHHDGVDWELELTPGL